MQKNIESYKDRYLGAREEVKSLVASGIISQEAAEHIFPELKENEDEEKIRQEIMDYLRSQQEISSIQSSMYDTWIDWLEKQGGEEINDDDLAILENWEFIVKENKEKWQLSDWFVEATYLLIKKVKHAKSRLPKKSKAEEGV